MESTQSQNGFDDGWPWNCTRCGVTIYHDAPVCRECDRTERASGTPTDSRLRAVVRSFLAWMRSQSYLGFVTQVSAIAGVELLLTTLWIEVLFSGALSMPV